MQGLSTQISDSLTFIVLPHLVLAVSRVASLDCLVPIVLWESQPSGVLLQVYDGVRHSVVSCDTQDHVLASWSAGPFLLDGHRLSLSDALLPDLDRRLTRHVAPWRNYLLSRPLVQFSLETDCRGVYGVTERVKLVCTRVCLFVGPEVLVALFEFTCLESFLVHAFACSSSDRCRHWPIRVLQKLLILGEVASSTDMNIAGVHGS